MLPRRFQRGLKISCAWAIPVSSRTFHRFSLIANGQVYCSPDTTFLFFSFNLLPRRSHFSQSQSPFRECDVNVQEEWMPLGGFMMNRPNMAIQWRDESDGKGRRIRHRSQGTVSGDEHLPSSRMFIGATREFAVFPLKSAL